VDFGLSGELASPELTDTVRRVFLARLAKLEEDYLDYSGTLIDQANSFGPFQGRNWERLNRKDPDDSFVPFPEGADGPSSYCDVVSSFANRSGFWSEISNAWDGALNFQKQYNALGQFDTGPYVMTYSQVGVVHVDEN
jgi:hypothetical protein